MCRVFQDLIDHLMHLVLIARWYSVENIIPEARLTLLSDKAQEDLLQSLLESFMRVHPKVLPLELADKPALSLFSLSEGHQKARESLATQPCLFPIASTTDI